MTCSGGVDPCRRPNIRVDGTLSANPASKADPRFQVNTNDYAITVNRGEITKNEPFVLGHTVSDGSGGGSCGGGGTIEDVVRRPLSTVRDPLGVVTLNGDNSFTLAAGTYHCSISAQGYQQPQGFKVQLRNISTGETFNLGSQITLDLSLIHI